jgi:Zn-dependent protease
MMQNGYLGLGRIGGAPVRVHWTAPVVIIGLSLLLNGLRFAPGAWLGILILIVIHEIGHAVVVRAFGLGLLAVEIRGIGGQCQWYGSPTPIRRAIIAWGGVLGQAVVLAIALPVSRFLPPDTPSFVVELVGAFIYSNLYLMVFNLLPIPGFDGVEAWKLFGRDGLPAWWRKRRARKSKKQSGVVRSLPVHKRFTGEDILEKTPTSTKRPPPHMLN